MQKNDDIRQLFKRYEQGECSPEEEARLHRWLNHYARNEADGLDELKAEYQATARSAGRSGRAKWSSYAAAAAIVIAAVWYFNDRPAEDLPAQITHEQVDDDIVLPDYNSAILTLADGREILLDEKSAGLSVQEAGVKIIQQPDGSLLYETMQGTASNRPAYNTFQTPKGNTYAIVLPDGTKVWLNTASSLRYPVSFTGKERRVSLDGEAYFEVAHDLQRPFYVDARGSTVQVLGTHFNVSAYGNEPLLKTTLVEGAVDLWKDGQNVSLRPNQQATIDMSTGRMTRSEADIWSALAWKNGYFRFDRASLEDIFVVISRWYDIKDIEYRGEFDNRFSGTFQRSKNISELFRYLEKLAPIQFDIKEGRVVVMK